MTIDLSRRQMISSMGAGLGTVGLALSAHANSDDRNSHHSPRAKRVIQLFMNGGPFHGDLFDPKPKLKEYEGQRPQEVQLRTERATAGLMPSPYKFRAHGQSGLEISELLPELSSHADELCLLRGVYTDNPNHGPALLLMNNGTIIPTRPSMGSWLSYGLGSENENLPSYVVLCPGRPVRFSILWSSAFLPSEHQGTYINHSKMAPELMIPNLHNPRWAGTDQARQLEFLKQINREHSLARSDDLRLDARIRSMETAFRMQSAALEAFDITHEPKAVREDYGEGHFANGCLLARRLAERGVRCTQVYYGNGQPWDTHNDHNQKVKELSASIDKPIAALLGDLKCRGMLDDTLVIWGGEFGRTPTTENGNGRDHNHYGFTMWMAGGGVKGGMSFGETDEFGFRAAHNRTHIHDIHATILHLMGFDHEQLTYRYAGRDFRLTDVEGRVVREILS